MQASEPCRIYNYYYYACLPLAINHCIIVTFHIDPFDEQLDKSQNPNSRYVAATKLIEAGITFPMCIMTVWDKEQYCT